MVRPLRDVGASFDQRLKRFRVLQAAPGISGIQPTEISLVTAIGILSKADVLRLASQHSPLKSPVTVPLAGAGKC